jgi:phytoene dehydrogenase-like protein
MLLAQGRVGTAAPAAARPGDSNSGITATTTATTTAGRRRRRPLLAPARAAAADATPPVPPATTTAAAATTAKARPYPSAERVAALRTDAPADVTYDAIVVGAGMGGLTAAAKMCEHGLGPVLVLERYLVPGGSSARYERDGYTFDVGSSMMFGMGQDGETNLITRALASVGRSIETLPDPTQVHYHLPASAARPGGLEVRVWRDFEAFARELAARFPHEEAGIRRFYGECWRVFNALNALELKSLEEPRYLLQQFARDPAACLTLASFLTTNCGDVARRHIRDPELLRFVDAECYIWSTVLADDTPMVNAGMVFCDRHYGGINYPKGGVGGIAEAMAEGLESRYPFSSSSSSAGGGGGGGAKAKGALVVYKAGVQEILLERDEAATAADGTAPGYRACGVRLADGREFRARAVVSNATRWDTFERLLLREGKGGKGGGASEERGARMTATPEAAELRAASAALAAEEAAAAAKAQQQQRAGSRSDASTSTSSSSSSSGSGNSSHRAAAATMQSLPATERAFRGRFRKAPSFVSLHVGVDAAAVPAGADVHHIVIEDWAKMEDPRGTLFVSVPTL